MKKCYLYKKQNGNPKLEREFLSQQEAADFFEVTEACIRYNIKNGNELVGGLYLLDEAAHKITQASNQNTWLENNTILTSTVQNKQETMPRMLFLDIEVSPSLSWTFGLYNQNIGISQIESNWYILCWSAKWLDGKNVFSARLTGKEAINEDDSRICQELWNVMDEADIICGHNSEKFDIPKINSRFVIHGMLPTSPFKQIDTCKIARNQFGFTSNKLDYLAQCFGIEGKHDTDFSLWKKCVHGDDEALKYMSKYCAHDVEILEKVYLKLRPFAKGHGNFNLYSNEASSCTHCGSTKLELIPDKGFFTQSVEYQMFRCKDCGAVVRSKQGVKFLNKKKVSSIPK